MKRAAIAVLIALALSIPAWADSESRKATKSEQDFTLHVLQVIDKAMPAVPTGWTVVERSQVRAEDNVGTGTENQPMVLFYHLNLEDQKKLADADAATNKAIQEVAMNNQDKLQANHDVEIAKMEAIAKQMEAAINKGDMALVQKLQKELEKVQIPMVEEGNKVGEELKAKTQPLRARDARAYIEVSVNLAAESVQECVRLADQAGRPVYWQAYSEGLDDRFEGECKTFFGAWKLAQDGDWTQMMTAANLSLPHTVVQNVMIKVSGDLNWSLIKTLFPAK
jgi:hypothetical protein